MITQSELGKHWGLTKGRVSHLVKEGCPLNSLRAADLWRNKRGNKRAPTNSKGAKVPLRPDKKERAGGNRGRPRKKMVIVKTGDSLLDLLNNAISAADMAFDLFSEAVADGDDTLIASRLSVHSKAAEARMNIERVHREEQERRGILVRIDGAKALFRKGFDFILKRMKALPHKLAPHCNPKNPLLAFKILDAEVNSILTDAQKLYSEEQL